MTSSFNDHLYLKICSEKTLQTNSKGFFMNFAQLVNENAGEIWIKNVFGKFQTDSERIRSVYSFEGTKDPIIRVLSNVQEIYRKKSAQVSQAKRLEAEEAYQKKDMKKSLVLYSQSVIRAPKTGEDFKYDSGGSLTLALWGRAQVLMSLKEYALALVDIQQALKENIPNIFKADAYWKMAICYKALKQDNRANVSFTLAEKLLETSKRIEDLNRDRNTSFIQNRRVSQKVKPEIQGETHKTYPYATNKLSIKSDKGMGRYAVANKEIKTGEVLVVEPPYAACLLPELFGTHCHHCFERLFAPIGCPDCSNVAFCSPECKEAALSSYHRYECKYLDLLIGSGMSILAHTALRMITQYPLGKCLEIYNNRSKEKVYSLCTNAEKRSAEDFLQRTLMAAFLLRCLQKCGYFGGAARDNLLPTEEEYRVGELLLFHLQILQFNAHEIYETRRAPEHRFKGSKTAYIGVAIYPTVALFNHDCQPAVTRHFVGKNIVIKSSKPLLPQEVVAENYGPIFTRMSLPERQRSLSSRYWFNCRCDACNFNWPTLDAGLEKISKKIKCSNDNCSYYFTLPVLKERLECPRCKENVILTEQMGLLKWCEEQYELGFQEMNSERPELAIEILCKALDVFHRISCPPHRETHLAQETLQVCVASFGNVSEMLVRKTDSKA